MKLKEFNFGMKCASVVLFSLDCISRYVSLDVSLKFDWQF